MAVTPSDAITVKGQMTGKDERDEKSSLQGGKERELEKGKTEGGEMLRN